MDEKKQEDIPEDVKDVENVDEVEEVEHKEEEKKETKKYVHNCTKCGKCCEKWEEIPIYLEDLQKWLKDGTIHYVLPHIQLK